MAMSVGKFEVVKFDGHGNFGLWQTRVKDLLAQQGTLKALRPRKPEAMNEEDWEELQQRAAGTIRLCLGDEIMYHVMNLSSPGDIWKKLETQFMSKSLTNKLYLKQRLYGLKMQEGSDLAQHVNVFNHIISDLSRLDVNVEDEDRAMILLCSLPSSYEHLVTTLTYGKETIKVEEITAALLAHNQRKQNAGESSQGDSLYVKSNQDRGWKFEKEGSGRRNSRSESKGKKVIHCFKCKEPGHMKKDCPRWKMQRDGNGDHSSKSVNVAQNEDTGCSDGDMLSVSTTQFMDAWILDSGCSYHITPNKEWFSSYRSVNSGSVYLGDDRCCNIIGIGDIRIKMYDGTIRTLCEVRHVPDLKKNLISIGTLHRNGFVPKAEEDRETIKIVKGALVVMKGKLTAGNNYKLLGSTVVGGVHSVGTHGDGLARGRERHTRKPPRRFGSKDIVSFAKEDSTTFQGAITSKGKEGWMGARVEKMESLQKNQSWKQARFLEGRKVIGCKWLVKKRGVEQGGVKLHGDSQSTIRMAKKENAADKLTLVTTNKFKQGLNLLNTYSF